MSEGQTSEKPMSEQSTTTFPSGKTRRNGSMQRRGPREVARKRPNMQMRYRMTSMLHWSDRLVRGAVSAYDGFIDLNDDDTAAVYLDMGLRYCEHGDFEEAETSLRTLLELQPKNERGWLTLSKVQVKLGTPEKAINSLRVLEALDRDSFALRIQLADVFVELEKHDEAAAELCRAIEWRPNAAEAHYRLGVCLDKVDRYDEAVAAFERAIEISPRTSDYYQSLGFAYESVNERKKAIECFKRGVELERRQRMDDDF